MSEDIYSNNTSHEEIINEFRGCLSENISAEMSDFDCLRFLRARKGNIEQTVLMAQNWYDWRHTLLEPLNLSNGLRFSPNIIMSSPTKLDTHPQKHLLPVSHHGFDKLGNPIYWEKAGYIQSIYSTVKKHFRKEELIQMHIMSMEILSARCAYASSQFGLNSTASVTISDMAGVSVSLDMDCIWYMQQLLSIDQAYYPEILHKFIIINSPWYFPALYNMFKPFIDVRTRDKVIILGTDYLPTLEQFIDRSVIPTEYGGDCPEIKWDAIYDLNSGANVQQLNEFFSPRNYRKFILSSEEISALRSALTVAERLDELPFIDTLPQMTSTTPSTPSTPNTHLLPPPSSPSITTTTTTQPTPPPSSPSVAQSSKEQKKRAKHVWKPKGMFQVPNLKVSDMLSATVTGSEDMGSHDQYIIQVNCGETISWQVKRRYSEFYSFKKRMIRVVPEAKDYDMPQKVLFKRSETVVNHRITALGAFLRTCIEGCATYGTEEQDLIFRFLNAYENILRTVEIDDETIAEMSVKESEKRRSEFSTDGFDQSEDSSLKEGEDTAWMGEKKNQESSETYWRTPFAAAVLTAWVVLSVVGPAMVGSG